MSTNTRSILRYPGSKARLVPFISKVLTLNGIKDTIFSEPFCGGASVSISLLEQGHVGGISLNDADPLVSSLWDIVFSPKSAKKLADKIFNIPLNIEEWKKYKAMKPRSKFEAALKCLYLNRTSFNGILHQSGPLGGWEQKNRTVGARFNRERIANRILELSEMHDYVFEVSNLNWKEYCNKHKKYNYVFYLDPPFYYKAEQLYGHTLAKDDHLLLSKYLFELDSFWMLSYDDSKEVRDLYNNNNLKSRVIDSTYSAHPMGGASFVGKELFYSNLSRLPSAEPNDKAHSGITIRRTGNYKQKVDGPIRIPTFS